MIGSLLRPFSGPALCLCPMNSECSLFWTDDWRNIRRNAALCTLTGALIAGCATHHGAVATGDSGPDL